MRCGELRLKLASLIRMKPGNYNGASMRRGVTLIELLITITIMIVVLAAVIPLMSPNNNDRKIREASRQLTTMLAQAKAQAARDGKPVGIAFQEFGEGPTYSGMALEAFFIAEPEPFTGFSGASAVRLRLENGVVREAQFVTSDLILASAGPPPGDPSHNPSTYDWDNMHPEDSPPPTMISFGDTIEIGKSRFLFSDVDQDGDGMSDEPDFKQGMKYNRTERMARFDCTAVGSGGLFTAQTITTGATAPVPYNGWTTPRPYKIRRLPTNTSDSPLQFPRGIGIDMQASGAEGNGATISFDGAGANVVGIVFSPGGAMSALYFDGQLQDVPDRVFFNLGLFENGNGWGRGEDWDFLATPVTNNAEVDERKARINWLHPDARWVAVDARSGRATAHENYSFNPVLAVDDTDDDVDNSPDDHDFDNDEVDIGGDRDDQVSVARRYARTGETEGGR